MAVQSYDIDDQGKKVPAGPPPKARPPAGPDWSLLLIKAGGWLAVSAFGGLFWLVNGAFSVIGLETISTQFGPGGLLFWEAVSAIPVPITFAVPGLPPTQPLVPWLGVVAASLIQVGIVWRSVQRRPIPWWVVVVGVVLSFYDASTTFFGLGTLQWVQWSGLWGQIPASAILTFGLEAFVGVLLKRR